MHLRLRPSQQDPSRKLVFLVQADNQETPDPGSQKRWDDEQESRDRDYNLDGNIEAGYFIQRLPRNVPFIEASSVFVIEFMDSGCKFSFVILNGIAQWYFENTCSDINRHNMTGLHLPPGSKAYKHTFFTEELISLTKNTVDNIACLWEGRYDRTGWVCGDEYGHEHYLVKVSLELDIDQQIPDGQDANYAMYMICGNARLGDFFRGLCRHKLNDYFSITQLFWDSDGSNQEVDPKPGMSYTYLTARIRELRVEDLGWNIGESRLVWVLPLPCEMAECSGCLVNDCLVNRANGYLVNGYEAAEEIPGEDF